MQARGPRSHLLLLCFSTIFLIVSSFSSLHGQVQEKEVERNAALLDSENINERYRASAYLSTLSKEELGLTILANARSLYLNELRAVKRFGELASVPGITIEKIPSELRHVNTEQWSEYFHNLCNIVAKLGEIELLTDLLAFKTSPKEIVNYGEAAVDPAIKMMNKAASQGEYIDPSRQSYAAKILVHYLKEKDKGYVARGDVRGKITGALIDKVLAAKDTGLRIFLIKSFGDIGDEKFVPILEEIEKSDSWKYEAKANPMIEKDTTVGEKVIRYPARIAAREALEKIRQKKIR